jgi:hypothetical protein
MILSRPSQKKYDVEIWPILNPLQGRRERKHGFPGKIASGQQTIDDPPRQ